MTYKRLPRHSRPAEILLRRAARQALTSTERAQPPQVFGPDPLQPGDVLVDAHGGFLVIEPAAEPVIALHGTPTQLLQAAFALGAQQVPMAIQAEHICVLPGAYVHALEHELGLRAEAAHAPFAPVRNVIAEHHHHDCGHDHHHGHHHDGDHAH